MMTDSLDRLDRSLTLLVNGLHSPLTDSIWIFFSDRFLQIPVYLLMLALLLSRLGWKKTLFALAGIALCILLCDRTAELVKYSVARLRPCHDDEMIAGGLRVLEGKGHLYGFFSAHAANCFGVASFVCVCLTAYPRGLCPADKRGGNGKFIVLIFVWAALVSLSRVFVGKHFLGDVLTGTFVGLVYGLILGKLAAGINRRSGSFGKERR